MEKFISRYFKMSEFHCRDGTKVPTRFHDRARELALSLDIIRDEVGVLHILSGYRTKSHNDKVGGSPRSQHLLMRAADITARSCDASTLHKIVLRLIAEGRIPDGGVGFYPSFVHYDHGPARRWSGFKV